jgi:hypothetical protein
MHHKKLYILIVTFVVAIAALFVLSVPARAVDGTTSISISPLTFDLAANPGDTVTNELLIRNSSSEPVIINAEAQDFVATGEEGEVSLTDNKSTYSLTSWIDLDTSRFTLEAGKQKAVKFSISVPYNAEPGGHYASIYARISPNLENTTSGSGVGQKIGSLLLLKVAGDTKETAAIESFKTTKYVNTKGPIAFDVRVKNTGSVHIKPKGIIAITDIFGNKVADLNVEQKNVLPDAIRHMSTSWEKPPMMGKFTATLLTYYGTGNSQLSAATTFWIIPWNIILGWATVIIFVSIVLWLNRKRIKNAIKAFINSK